MIIGSVLDEVPTEVVLTVVEHLVPSPGASLSLNEHRDAQQGLLSLLRVSKAMRAIVTARHVFQFPLVTLHQNHQRLFALLAHVAAYPWLAIYMRGIAFSTSKDSAVPSADALRAHPGGRSLFGVPHMTVYPVGPFSYVVDSLSTLHLAGVVPYLRHLTASTFIPPTELCDIICIHRRLRVVELKCCRGNMLDTVLGCMRIHQLRDDIHVEVIELRGGPACDEIHLASTQPGKWAGWHAFPKKVHFYSQRAPCGMPQSSIFNAAFGATDDTSRVIVTDHPSSRHAVLRRAIYPLKSLEGHLNRPYLLRGAFRMEMEL